MLEGLKLRCRSLFNSNVDISSMPTTSANIDLIFLIIKLIAILLLLIIETINWITRVLIIDLKVNHVALSEPS